MGRKLGWYLRGLKLLQFVQDNSPIKSMVTFRIADKLRSYALSEVGMYSRCCAAFGAVFMMSTVFVSQAAATDHGSAAVTFQDWRGSLEQTTLPDGSVLNEYVASTQSGSTAGATLTLSFVPRFGCSPVFSVVLPAELADEADRDANMTLVLDQLSQDFPVLVDSGNSEVRLSLNAESDTQRSVRKQLDEASRASVSWQTREPPLGGAADTGNVAGVVADAGPTDQPFPVSFSLLGSKMTSEAVEKRCIGHEPIPYDN